jgi:phenylpropionate dioxygenase-like ring-hydroxylating dioxygenase large terminal subunit
MNNPNHASRSAGESLGVASGPTYASAALGLPNYWYPAMASPSLGGRPKPYTLLGQNIMFVRRQNRAYALENRCPHRGIPLHQGKFEFQGTISCIYHGWTFDLATGQLVAALPDGPDSPMPGRSVCAIRSYPLEERAGLIWIWMGDGAPMVPVEEDIPEEMLRDDMHIIPWFHVRYGNWRFGVENAVDEAHARFLHRDSILRAWRQRAAWTNVKIRETPDKKWLYRDQDFQQTYAYYPKLGVWPWKHWWRPPEGKINSPISKRARRLAMSVIPEDARKGSVRLPCIFRPSTYMSPSTISYEWHVPVDKEHTMYLQAATRHTTNPLLVFAFKLRYWLWYRWLAQWRFNSQDGSMVDSMTRNTEAERLMKPDASITAWRKMVERQARGQVDEWRSIGVEHDADLSLEYKGTDAQQTGPAAVDG